MWVQVPSSLLIKKFNNMEPKESKSNNHFQLSLIKSALRILGCVYLIFGCTTMFAIIFIFAEVLGILEEML